MQKSKLAQAFFVSCHQLVHVYLKWLFIFFCGLYMASGVYNIERNAVGVQTRFGAVIEPRVPPGLHYKLPWPIDRIRKIPLRQVKTLTVNDFALKYTADESGRAFKFQKATHLDPYCISGDNNIVSCTLIIKYTISDPVAYLFSNKQSEAFVGRAAASSVVHQLAQLQVDDILTSGKKSLEFHIKQELNEEMEALNTGVTISFLEIKEISPPSKVQDEFNKVINAKVHKKKIINQAQGYHNRIVPQARMKADKIVQEATAYKNEKVLRAEGKSARFLSRLAGYRQQPSTNRKKIYLDFIKTLYPSLAEIRVVGAKSGKVQPGELDIDQADMIIPMR